MTNMNNVESPILSDETVKLEANNLPLSPGIKSFKNVLDPTLKYYSIAKNTGRGHFAWPEYNLSDIGRIEDTDSYVRQAFDKKVGLLFKEGFVISGRNENVVQYVNQRLQQIRQVTGVPFDQFLRSVGSAVVKKNNAFIVKVRKAKASGGRVRKDLSGKKLEPIAGLFTAPAETMRPEIQGNKIIGWKQETPQGMSELFPAQDVIHIAYQVKDGFIFATPSLIPVVDDIRALRKLEENTELVVYQFLFPLLHYKVGSKERPAGVGTDGVDEITRARSEIELMPSEGGIVTSERHEINLIGAEGRALRVESYLDHFKQRVFAGLGMSAVDFGEGETANRATADNMSRNLVDSVKDIQDIIEMYINHFVIDELLEESTFGQDVFLPENHCSLVFREVDIDAQIKKENHAAELFSKDMFGLNQSRERIGVQPIALPTPKEVNLGQDTPEKYPEWNQMRWKLLKLPELLIQSIDEPWTSEARNALGIRGQTALETAEAKTATKKTSDSLSFNDSLIKSEYAFLHTELDDYLRMQNDIDLSWVGNLVRLRLKTIQDKIVRLLMQDFETSYLKTRSIQDITYVRQLNHTRTVVESRISDNLDRLATSIHEAMLRNISKASTHPERIRVVHSVLDTFQYRVNYIEKHEPLKMKNLGMMTAKLDSGEVREWSFECASQDCLDCQEHCKYQIDAEDINIDMIPPFHPNCGCKLLPNEMTPLNKDQIEKSDSEKLDECVMSIKTSLQKRWPKWSTQKVESTAYAICHSRLKE